MDESTYIAHYRIVDGWKNGKNRSKDSKKMKYGSKISHRKDKRYEFQQEDESLEDSYPDKNEVYKIDKTYHTYGRTVLEEKKIAEQQNFEIEFVHCSGKIYAIKFMAYSDEATKFFYGKGVYLIYGVVDITTRNRAAAIKWGHSRSYWEKHVAVFDRLIGDCKEYDKLSPHAQRIINNASLYYLSYDEFAIWRLF